MIIEEAETDALDESNNDLMPCKSSCRGIDVGIVSIRFDRFRSIVQESSYDDTTCSSAQTIWGTWQVIFATVPANN